ncbi:MAG: Ig-like domain-containing protein [Candidatus Delongbacteria bacterium]|nr:Ig-like domain-containing protein [Candidatus Cloacimonadota bacterium]MCB9474142.1 Ig-like domain-containing protein [Candidatus Delongbacteria bacterium]
MKKTAWVSLTCVLLAASAFAEPGMGVRGYVPPSRELNQFVTTEVGNITLSADGLGMMATNGFLQVEKPSPGATVRVAYLIAASTGFLNYSIPSGSIQLAGSPVNWSHSIPNGIASWNHLADVTSILAPVLDPAGAGILNVSVYEPNSQSVDGTALYVIFDDPVTIVTRTAVLAFGAQATSGDVFSIGFGQPIFPDANTVVEFGLGISYGYARGTCQTSYVDVNGQRLTSSAGGNDEGENQNGALMTVGGVGDSRSNPLDPMFNDPCSYSDFTTYDDELYNIASYIGAGSTSMTVNTFNPSADDNIFAATLLLDFAAVVGEGAVLTPSTAALCVGDSHTATLTLQDPNGNPLVNQDATLEITSGPNVGLLNSGTTNSLGQLSLTWASATPGVDVIAGSFLNSNGVLQYSNFAETTWQNCQSTEDGVLSPLVGTTCLESPYTVTLTLQDGSGTPLVGRSASILVLSGPHVGQTVSGLSDANGQFAMTLTGTTSGTDTFRGSFTNGDGLVEYTPFATVDWQQCVQQEIGVLSPTTASSCLGVPYTVTLVMEDSEGNLVPDFDATIEIISGPNSGLMVSGPTDANGELALTYVGAVIGTDMIQASFVNSSGNPDVSNTAVNTWQACNTGGWGEVTPVFSSGCMGDDFTATVTLRGGSGNPLVNYPATLEVFEGPNTGVSVSGFTNILGQMQLTYTSDVIGNDKLRGIFFDEFGEERETNEAEREWVDCSLGSPTIRIQSSSLCNMELTWDTVPGATHYNLYSRTGLDQAWELELSTGNPFVTIGCVTGVPVRIYQVTALSN